MRRHSLEGRDAEAVVQAFWRRWRSEIRRGHDLLDVPPGRGAAPRPEQLVGGDGIALASSYIKTAIEVVETST
jgi:hypothetical protein